MEITFIILALVSIIVILFLFLVIYRKTLVREKVSTYNTQLDQPAKQLDYIPKQIFQLTSNKHKLHSKFKKNIKYIQKLNPDWKYVLMDDDDMVAYLNLNYPPYILELYNKINPKYGAARADFFRYLLMYKEGGVYLDLKSAMKYPLTNVINKNDEYILSHWGCPCHAKALNIKHGEFQQWHIICRPRHPFLANVINNVIKNIQNYKEEDGTGKDIVLDVTGPKAYTRSILPILKENKHRLVEIDEYIGLIYNNLEDYQSLYSKKHYSKIREKLILN